MSYTYLQDRGGVSLADCFSAIHLFAPLSGTKTLETNLSNDKKTEPYQDSQFGMTSAPLTGSRGTESSILSVAVFRAKTSAQQDTEKDLKEKDQAFGRKWQGSLAKWDQDLFLWKTHQLSLITDSVQLLESFPRWGIMQDGELWELTIQDYHTTAIGAGLLPTIVKTEGMSFLGGPLRSTETWRDTGRLSHRLIGLWKNFAHREMNGRIKQKIACHPTFAEWMMGWPEMWSDSNELEMDKFQAWLHLHLKYFQEKDDKI
jgi:hypothetical protein